MPTVFPIQWEPLAKTGRYDHMQKGDHLVWERWLDAHAAEYDQVAYDVAVGGLLPAAGDGSDAQRRGWQYSTALKIDALLRRAAGLTIVEVRPTATTSAVGAALCYQLVLTRELPDEPIEAAGVACASLPPDIAYCAEQLQLLTWVV